MSFFKNIPAKFSTVILHFKICKCTLLWHSFIPIKSYRTSYKKTIYIIRLYSVKIINIENCKKKKNILFDLMLLISKLHLKKENAITILSW